MTKPIKYSILITLYIFTVCLLTAFAEQNEILIGIDADMSSGSALSGQAILRGARIATDELNKKGGLLGRPLVLKVMDHRGNPARGIDNIAAFSKMKNLVAILGGLHTPVAMAELDIVHEKKVIYLCPWAAGTSIVRNNRFPNYVFRLSVRDEYAGAFLIEKTFEAGHLRPALLLEQTGWGRSNKKSMSQALKTHGTKPAGIFWFNWGTKDMSGQIRAAKNAGADVILLVANSPEGVAVVKSMAELSVEERLPIISHWGITGGSFWEQTKSWLPEISFQFLQTYSFMAPAFPHRNNKVVTAYCKDFPKATSARDIFAPVGTAHAYDLIHLLGKAVENAGTIDSSVVRSALEQIKFHRGLVKDYAPPFTDKKHDALDTNDFSIAEYTAQGIIVPVKAKGTIN